MTATEHSGLGPTRTEIRDTVIRMRADLAHRWTSAELAQDAHLSPSRLGGLFVEQFGVRRSCCWLGCGCGDVPDAAGVGPDRPIAGPPHHAGSIHAYCSLML